MFQSNGFLVYLYKINCSLVCYIKKYLLREHEGSINKKKIEGKKIVQTNVYKI